MITTSNKEGYTSTLSLLIGAELPFFKDYYSSFARVTSAIKFSHENTKKR
jgi:hypothetical protein